MIFVQGGKLHVSKDFLRLLILPMKIILFRQIFLIFIKLLIQYKNQLYYPVIFTYSETTFGGDFETEAEYRDPFVRELIEENGWIIWPPIPYHYDTVNYNLKQPAPSPPDGDNILGTDDQARDVAARLLYGYRISLLFGVLLTVCSTIIGMTAGLIIGILCQVFQLTNYSYLNDFIFDGLIDALGQIFIVSLKMMVVPLVFLSLTCGAASLGASGSIGRLGGKTILLYLFTTAIAVSVALGFALLINPGEGGVTSAIETPGYEPKPAPDVKDTLINIFPDNPVAAMAEGSMLQIIVFALLLGFAISKSGEPGKRILGLFESANTVMLELIMFIVQLAPYGVFCLMMKLGLGIGLYEILKLAKYFFTVVAVLIFHGLGSGKSCTSIVIGEALKNATGLTREEYDKGNWYIYLRKN